MTPSRRQEFLLRATEVLFLCVVFTAGCKKDNPVQTHSNKAYSLLVASLDDYRTNDLHKAYPMMVSTEAQLSRMAITNPKDLEYDVVLAKMNARLFVMARQLGEIEAAQGFYEKSVACYKRVLKSRGLEPKSYSPEEIGEIVKALDEKLRSTSTVGDQ
jgi:hypothetical protein